MLQEFNNLSRKESCSFRLSSIPIININWPFHDSLPDKILRFDQREIYGHMAPYGLGCRFNTQCNGIVLHHDWKKRGRFCSWFWRDYIFILSSVYDSTDDVVKTILIIIFHFNFIVNPSIYIERFPDYRKTLCLLYCSRLCKASKSGRIFQSISEGLSC